MLLPLLGAMPGPRWEEALRFQEQAQSAKCHKNELDPLEPARAHKHRRRTEHEHDQAENADNDRSRRSLNRFDDRVTAKEPDGQHRGTKTDGGEKCQLEEGMRLIGPVTDSVEGNAEAETEPRGDDDC